MVPDSKTLSGMYAGVEAYYSARVAKHGATPLGVDWSCWATQSLRFVNCLDVAFVFEFDQCSIVLLIERQMINFRSIAERDVALNRRIPS